MLHSKARSICRTFPLRIGYNTYTTEWSALCAADMQEPTPGRGGQSCIASFEIEGK